MNKELKADLQEQLARQRQWEAMTPEQKKKQLFLDQKALLEKFLSRHAISQEQYQISMAVITGAMNRVS